MELPPILVYAGSWVMLTGGIWFLFERAETVTSPQAKEAISRWLRNIRPESAFETMPATFEAIFDSVFGKRHLSWHCFYRSCMASLFSVTILYLLWNVIRPLEVKEFLADAQETPYLYFRLLALALPILASSNMTFLPDYLSLLETRYVIRWMKRKSSMFGVVTLLILDIGVTAVIFIVYIAVIFLGALLLITIQDGVGIRDSLNEIFDGAITEGLMEFFWDMLRLSTRSELALISPGIFFYSTFFTSIWVWLYALSSALVKTGSYFGWWVKRIISLLDIENKPIRSIGFIAIMLVTLLYLILPMLF